MKYEKLDFSSGSKYKWILCGIIIGVLLIIIVNFIFSYAKYKSVDSVKLASGTITYSNADFTLIAMYMQDGTEDNPQETYNTKLNEVPTSKVELNEEKTFCKVGDITYTGKEQYIAQGIHIEYTGTELNFTGIKKTNTKCTVYFNLSGKGSGDKTLSKLFSGFSTADSGTNFKTENGVLKVTGVDTEDHPKTLYKAEDNDGVSYFFRGQASDNWVQFAGMKWRIIRINGDGSIRMIFQCKGDTCIDTQGTGTNIQTSVYHKSPYNDNAYVGYYYGSPGQSTGTDKEKYDKTHTNATASTIAEVVNNWYKDNLLTKYNDYIDPNAGFCNDRQINNTDEIWDSRDTKKGYGTYWTNYASFGRLMISEYAARNPSYPTLKCGVDPAKFVANRVLEKEQKQEEVDSVAYNRDLFTAKESSKGNRVLEYPIGLLTADEAVLAGGMFYKENTKYYLYTNQWYWTMSMSHYDNSSPFPSVLSIYVTGSIDYGGPYRDNGVRPVINLKANTTFSGGNGSSSDPFVVAANE